MPECTECGTDYELDDGCEPDGLCHPCAHAIADGQISKLVSARDLTIRDLRAALRESAKWIRDHSEPDPEGALGIVLRVSKLLPGEPVTVCDSCLGNRAAKCVALWPRARRCDECGRPIGERDRYHCTFRRHADGAT